MNLHSAALYVNVCTRMEQASKGVLICMYAYTLRRDKAPEMYLLNNREKKGFDLLQPEPLRVCIDTLSTDTIS